MIKKERHSEKSFRILELASILNLKKAKRKHISAISEGSALCLHVITGTQGLPCEHLHLMNPDHKGDILKQDVKYLKI